MLDREFELRLIEGDIAVRAETDNPYRFGADITRENYERLRHDKDWIVLHDNYNKGVAMQYAVRKGAVIDKKLLDIILRNVPKLKFLPIELPEGRRKDFGHKLTDFSKQCGLLMVGGIFDCVQSWINLAEAGLEYGFDEYMVENRGRLAEPLLQTTANIDILANSISRHLKNTSNIVAFGLYKEISDDMWDYEFVNGNLKERDDKLKHAMELTVLAGILAYRLRMREELIPQLITSALLHDIGKLPALCDQNLSMNLHPLYGAALLTGEDGKIIPGFDQSIRYNILQHEQHIDGSGSSVYHENYQQVLESMGVDPNTVYNGFNKLPSDVITEDQYPIVGRTKSSKRMTTSAQVISMLEYFLTRKEKVGAKEAITEMVPKAGVWWNGPMFDKFVAETWPADELPELNATLERGLPKWNGATIEIRAKELWLSRGGEEFRLTPNEIYGRLKFGTY